MISLLESFFCNWIYALTTFYLGIEVMFCVAFHKCLVPRANRIVSPIPYRDAGKDRCKLLLRILKRIEETCEITKEDVKEKVMTFLSEWFHVARNPLNANDTTTSFPRLSSSFSSSPESSDDEDCLTDPPICLYKQDIDDFFAWTFFGKYFLTLLPWEAKELDRIYQLLEQRHGITFPSNQNVTESEILHHCKPRCMTLEPVNAIHRPLLVYMIVYGMKILGGLFLRIIGFRRCVTKTGLVAWYRPAKDTKSQLLPLLFFHGIAPGGLMLYLPMVLYGFATEKDRPVFLFENRPISCALDFVPLTEDQIVEGVIKTLERFDLVNSKLSLVGHSFGSCPITWLLASKRLPNIKQVVLLDPVVILLSEPDVMVNFLYAKEMDKIRMVASSELFTEYYLRRHFAWYNSELWLEDVDCSLLVCLSEQDEIINASKVKQEVERHASKEQLVYWKGVGHAACVSSPTMWKQVKQRMLEQELKIAQDR
jgi:pimeloyl-ACP methyl ester carboxylesterase